MLLVAAATFTAAAQTENIPPSVVPVDDAGQPLDNQKTAMVPLSDGSYQLTGVTLGKGFLFEGANDKVSTYYALRAGAVTPAVEGLPNPLSIVASGTYIPVEPGTYDIVFDEGRSTGYRHFTITPESGTPRPPQKLFLLVPQGSSVKAVEMDAVGEGVYSLTGSAIPESFKVSYEPIDQSPYIFGPVTVPAPLELAVPVALDRADNTTYRFAYSPTLRQASDELTVTLDGEKATLLLSNPILTGIDDITIEGAPSDLYDLSGRPVGPTPTPGLYVDRTTRTIVVIK